MCNNLNILFLASWYPYPPDNGGRQRTYHLVQGLARQHDVTLIGLHDSDQSPELPNELNDACRRVITLPRRAYIRGSRRALAALFSPQPRFLADTFDEQMQQTVRQEFSGGKFDAIVASELSMAVYAAALPHRAKIFDGVEIGIFQDAFLQAPWPARGRHALTWYKFARYLSKLASTFEALTVPSQREWERVTSTGVNGERVFVVPNGVDCRTPPLPVRVEPYTLIYNGALSYNANLDAVRYFRSEILPLIRVAEPRVQLKITGRANQVAQNELSEDNVVLFTGYVSDIRAVVQSSAVCIVPLRLGGGTRLKILEAMACGVPVVATSKGAEGLGLQHNVHLLVADTPRAFAKETVALLRDRELRHRLTCAARERVCAEFDWTKVQARFERVLQGVTA